MSYITESVICEHQISKFIVMALACVALLIPPSYSLPISLLLYYSQMLFPQKEVAALDNRPSGYGKVDLATCSS